MNRMPTNGRIVTGTWLTGMLHLLALLVQLSQRKSRKSFRATSWLRLRLSIRRFKATAQAKDTTSKKKRQRQRG